MARRDRFDLQASAVSYIKSCILTAEDAKVAEKFP